MACKISRNYVWKHVGNYVGNMYVGKVCWKLRTIILNLCHWRFLYEYLWFFGLENVKLSFGSNFLNGFIMKIILNVELDGI